MDIKVGDRDWGSLPRCKGCGERILFIPTPKGKYLPVDPVRVVVKESNYEGILVREDGTINRSPRAGDQGWVPHWATCPKADQFRKPRS